MKSARVRALIAPALSVLLAAPFLFVRLGVPPFDDPGEGMHAEIARELALSGDPLVLTLNGVRYVDKPPLLYALQVAAFAVAGRFEASARAVSALAALAAVAATAWLGSRLLGATAGALAGVALLTSTLFFVFGRYVRPETLFVAALAWGFALALGGIVAGRRWLTGLGLVAFGIAGLAKDPLGTLAPPLVILAALLAVGRGRPVGRWAPYPAIAVALVLGLGWWAVAELRTAGTTWYTVVDNKLLNVIGARWFPDEDVPLSGLEFLAVAVLGAVPWSVLAGATVARLVRRRAWRDRAEVPWVALALWAVSVIALTLLSRFRLPHYGLPAYPALALLAARAWRELDVWRLAALHVLLFGALAVAAGAMWRGDGAWFMETVIDATDVATRKTRVAGAAAPFPPWETIRPLLGQTALVLAGGAVLTALTLVVPARRRRGAAMAAVAATMLGVMPSVGTALALMSAHRSVRDLALTVRQHAGAGDVVAHEGPIEGSGAFEWYAGLRPLLVDARTSVLGFGATRADARAVFVDGPALRAAWLTAGQRGERVWVLTARSPEQSVVGSLPGARLVRATAGRRLYVGPAAPPFLTK